MNSNKNEESFSLNQEVVHSLIHAFGILYGIISIPILTAMAAKNGNLPGIVGASIYGFCFLMLFTFSTIYHAVRHPQLKRILAKLDHISIYFLPGGIVVYPLSSTY